MVQEKVQLRSVRKDWELRQFPQVKPSFQQGECDRWQCGDSRHSKPCVLRMFALLFGHLSKPSRHKFITSPAGHDGCKWYLLSWLAQDRKVACCEEHWFTSYFFISPTVTKAEGPDPQPKSFSLTSLSEWWCQQCGQFTATPPDVKKE